MLCQVVCMVQSSHLINAIPIARSIGRGAERLKIAAHTPIPFVRINLQLPNGAIICD